MHLAIAHTIKHLNPNYYSSYVVHSRDLNISLATQHRQCPTVCIHTQVCSSHATKVLEYTATVVVKSQKQINLEVHTGTLFKRL